MPNSPTQPDDPLEITQNVAFQFRMHRFQRLAQILLFALPVCALAGLLGGGVLSRRRATDATGRLNVQYERFARYDASQHLEIETEIANADLPMQVWIDASFLRNIEIESIVPEPGEQRSAADRVFFAIDTAATETRPLVRISYRPLAVGTIRGRIGIGDRSVRIDQFVYP